MANIYKKTYSLGVLMLVSSLSISHRSASSACEMLSERGRLSNPLLVASGDFHHIGSPDEPIHAHLKPVRDLADAIKVQGAQHAHGFKVKSAPVRLKSVDIPRSWGPRPGCKLRATPVKRSDRLA